MRAVSELKVERGEMQKRQKPHVGEIRSELTHKQEVSLTHPPLSRTDIRDVEVALKNLENRQKASQ